MGSAPGNRKMSSQGPPDLMAPVPLITVVVVGVLVDPIRKAKIIGLGKN